MADRRFKAVVADSSALVALATCEALEVLERLVARISVPRAVFDEVAVEGKPQAESLRLFLSSRIETVDDVVLATGSLGRGELEAMALAKVSRADFLLLDDERARKIARFNGIRVIGSLGILLVAKQEGLVPEVTPLLDALRGSDLFFGEVLLLKVRQLAGE